MINNDNRRHGLQILANGRTVQFRNEEMKIFEIRQDTREAVRAGQI